jgi:hypothetical protein
MGVRNLAPKHVGRKEYFMEMPAMFKGESLTRLAQGARILGLVVVTASGIGFFLPEFWRMLSSARIRAPWVPHPCSAMEQWRATLNSMHPMH